MHYLITRKIYLKIITVTLAYFALIYSVCFCFSGVVFAQLAWNSQTVKTQVGAEDRSVEAAFKFSNTGNYPVTIDSIRPSCGCTTAKLEKNTYQPGESGVITVNFDIGDSRGMQIKKIMVETDDPDFQTSILTLRVDIPEILRVSHKYLFWKTNEEVAPKTIKIEVKHDEPIHVLSAKVIKRRARGGDKVLPEEEATGENEFITQLKVIEDGRLYEITVSPPKDTTNGRMRSMVVITTDGGTEEQPMTVKVPLMIFPAFSKIGEQRFDIPTSVISLKRDNSVNNNEIEIGDGVQ